MGMDSMKQGDTTSYICDPHAAALISVLKTSWNIDNEAISPVLPPTEESLILYPVLTSPVQMPKL